MRKQNGVSLVNLLVSLVLASSLLAILMHVLLQSLSQQKFFQAHVFLQEDANLLLQLLSEEIRLAGFSAYAINVDLPEDSCGNSRQWILDLSNKLDTQKNEQLSILGVPLLQGCLSIPAREGSDILFVRRLSAVSQVNGSHFEKAWYLLQREHYADEFLYLEVFPADLLQVGDLLWKVESKVFYVRDYSVQGDNTPSLVMAKPNARGFDHQVMVENIETLQLQWLVKEDESFAIVDIPTVEQLEKPVLLRVFLLMRSDNIKSERSEFVLARPYYLPDENKYYQAFLSSVYLRN